MKILSRILAIFSLLGTSLASTQITAPNVVNYQYLDSNQRLGISLNIGGASTDEVYLFDTGSSPLTSAWAAGAPWWGGSASIDTNTTGSIVYGGGSGTQKFDYYAATSSVSIISTSSLSASSSIDAVYAGYTNADSHASPASWQPDLTFDAAVSNAVTSNVAPFSSHVFGTLGADTSNTNAGFQNLIESQSYGTNVVKGYIISANLTNPTLTIAPTLSEVANFTNIYQMNTNTDGSIKQNLINGSFNMTFQGVTNSLGTLPTLLDTGTPPSSALFITQGSQVNVSAFTTNGYLEAGASMTMLIGNTPYTLTSSSNNLISVYGSPTDTGSGGITFGLNFFQNYDVLYNLANQTVGIQAVPEPSSLALISVAGLLLGVLMVRRFL